MAKPTLPPYVYSESELERRHLRHKLTRFVSCWLHLCMRENTENVFKDIELQSRLLEDDVENFLDLLRLSCRIFCNIFISIFLVMFCNRREFILGRSYPCRCFLEMTLAYGAFLNSVLERYSALL